MTWEIFWKKKYEVGEQKSRAPDYLIRGQVMYLHAKINGKVHSHM